MINRIKQNQLSKCRSVCSKTGARFQIDSRNIKWRWFSSRFWKFGNTVCRLFSKEKEEIFSSVLFWKNAWIEIKRQQNIKYQVVVLVHVTTLSYCHREAPLSSRPTGICTTLLLLIFFRSLRQGCHILRRKANKPFLLCTRCCCCCCCTVAQSTRLQSTSWREKPKRWLSRCWCFDVLSCCTEGALEQAPFSPTLD